MKSILTEKLNAKYPIIQGGMANIATAEFAAAVSLAGAIGLIGAGGWSAEKVEEEIIKIKELVGDKPYGVNVMLMNPQAPEIMKVCIKHNVPLITTGAGNPAPYVKPAHDAGMLIMPVVPNAAFAKKVEQLGVDAIIVEGTESGGHVGEETSLVAVSNATDICSVPIIAAGGIATAKQFAASFVLGAQGAQIGTVLLATEECPIHENYKNLVIEATPGTTIVTGRKQGAPVRSIQNKMTKEYQALEQTDITFMEIEHLTMGSLGKAVFNGDVDNGSFMAGQVVGQVNEIKTVEQVITEIANIKPIFDNLDI